MAETAFSTIKRTLERCICNKVSKHGKGDVDKSVFV